MQENRLNIANRDLQAAQAELDAKQAELDLVQAQYEKAMLEKQVCSFQLQQQSINPSLKCFFD